MKLLKKQDEKEVWLNQMDKPYKFVSPFDDGEAFVCILFNNDSSISNDDQNNISKELVEANCLYAVCAGLNCSTWDDSIDIAYILSDKSYQSFSDETRVMTTWHEGESVDDIIYFSLCCTNSDYHDFKKYLILFIGVKDALEEEVEEMINKEWDECC